MLERVDSFQREYTKKLIRMNNREERIAVWAFKKGYAIGKQDGRKGR